MAGGYVSWVCRLFGHDEPLWKVGPSGVCWLCPTCQREKASPVLRRTA